MSVHKGDPVNMTNNHSNWGIPSPDGIPLWGY